MDGWSLFGTDLAIMVAALSLAAIPSFRTKDASYIDALWGLGFVVVAVSSYLLTDDHGSRGTLLLLLTAVWGLRLATYLLWRWRKNGPDQRYKTLFGERASNVKLWLRVFVAQAVILTIVSLPVQLGMAYDGSLSTLNVVGVVVAAVGILVETVADAQLTRFKADPANHGTVMDRGLWGWSRHPNYFGESLTWWGIGLVAVSGGIPVLGLLGPLVITFFLLTRSGIGPLESQLKKTKPQYVDYIARTSAFVPLPPRRRVPA